MAPRLTPLQRSLRAKSEAEWQAEVLDHLAWQGWRVYHTHDSRRSHAGFPDVTAVHPKRNDILFAELKREVGTTSPEQDAWLADLREAGFDAYVWRPSDVDQVIARAAGRKN